MMKPTKKHEAEARKVYEYFWDSLLKADIKSLKLCLDDQFRQIGTTEAEVFFNKTEAIDFVRTTASQIVGNIELRNRNLKIELVDELVLIIEKGDTYVRIDSEWTFYSKFRGSTLLRQNAEDWKLIQQHISFPDTKAEAGQTIGLDKISKENLELRDAVKRRTTELEQKNRELELEAGLAKVRARTMAMQSSQELGDVATVLFVEMNLLVESLWTCGFVLCEKDRDEDEWWLSMDNGFTRGFFLPNIGDHTHATLYEGWLQGETFRTVQLEGNELQKHYEWLMELPVSREIFAEMDASGLERPDWQKLHGAYFSKGYLCIITKVPCEEEAIFKRFAQVFDQAYIRFLDLKKAEAQTREAQIETAVERVRAQSMAMHQTVDLNNVTRELLNQLNHLKIDGLTGTSIYLLDANDIVSVWDISSPGSISDPGSYAFTYDAKIYPILGGWVNTLRTSNQDYFVLDFPKEKLIKAVGEMKEILPEMAVHFKKAIDTGKLTHQWSPVARLSNGILAFDLTVPPTDDTKNIVTKMAGAFNQAYQRFLDLKKAEAQAREARIETALERVRSKAMAMHSSEDLASTVDTFFTELNNLNVTPRRCGVGIINPETRLVDIHVTTATEDNEVKKMIGNLTLIGHPVLENIYSHWIEQKEYHPILKGNEISTYYKAMNPEVKFPGFADDEVQYGYYFFFKESGVFAWTDKELAELELQIFRRYTSVLSLTYRRYMDLIEAEALTREAQIENALEKVRSRTMAMQHSAELNETADVMFQQVQTLGSNAWNCGFYIWEDDNKLVRAWNASKGTITNSFVVNNLEDVFLRFYEASKRGESLYVEEISGDECAAHYRYMRSLPVVGEIIKDLEANGVTLPTHQIFHIAYFPQGYLMFITYEPVPEMWEVFKRFGKVFEQTYTRFLDLQKAEAQAREAQIETALERVRARAMGMHHSEELHETNAVIIQQVKSLDISLFAMGIHVCSPDKPLSEAWIGDPVDGQLPKTIFSHLEDPLVKRMYDYWKSGESFVMEIMEGQALLDHFRYMHNRIPGRSTFDPTGIPIKLYYNLAFFKLGFLVFVSSEPRDKDHHVFQKFAQAFGQAHIRFQDLQKAETQAREAQIEMALERVRGKTMAMHSSLDVESAVISLFEEMLKQVADPSFRCGIGILSGSEKMELWTASINEQDSVALDTGNLDMTGHPLLRGVKQAWLDKTPRFYYHLKGIEVRSYYQALNEDVDYTFYVDMSKIPDEIFHNSFNFSEGLIYSFTAKPLPDETIKVFIRFAGVFELTYRRYLDLQKAELQAQKAKIETALEKVRARALAMQEPEELIEVAEVLRHEMGLLGVEELETCSIYINDKAIQRTECWYALKDIRAEEKKLVSDHFPLNLNDTWVGREMMKFYQTDANKLSIVMQGANRKEWINYCEEKSVPFRGYYGEVIPDRTYHLYKFSHGAIGAAAAGDISAESWDLLRRAASVFSLAYSRFKDLTQARTDLIHLKEEKKKAEDALIDLKAAQSQLVQSEKMASLGELTAGIAHEIQNPLNFVNNFSEVSNELLDEMLEEAGKGNYEEVKALLNDVKQNLEKINHHGKRADGIVKGMLQHSRSSSGKKEPTDINALCDEYLRLAYHGLRAKDNSFNANMTTDFDESLPKINVIPQDLGRVILNLITNAFYAASEKKKTSETDYTPTVTVKTLWVASPLELATPRRGVGGVSVGEISHVEISIQDNGSGIPNHIKEKIFQPFFTTKPTGQGTGLGLSLAYDIVKAHGGELKVETREGEGSEFVISLPV